MKTAHVIHGWRNLETKKNKKLTRVVFSVIAAFVICMAPNQILNVVYLVEVTHFTTQGHYYSIFSSLHLQQNKFLLFLPKQAK